MRDPVYGQVPAFAGGERGIMDLLAVDYAGRLAVVELKASRSHCRVQGSITVIRVKWHLGSRRVRRERILSRSCAAARRSAPDPGLPALEFHPTTEIILDYFAPTSKWNGSA